MKKMLSFLFVCVLVVLMAANATAADIVAGDTPLEAQIYLDQPAQAPDTAGDDEVVAYSGEGTEPASGEIPPEAPDIGKTPLIDLMNQWESEGYPDDIGNIYYDNENGTIVINLVGATQARKDEILAMLGGADGIVFGESKYSHNQLMEVYRIIAAEMEGKSDEIYGLGLGWAVINNQLTGFGDSGKEERVVVTVDEKIYADYAKNFEARFGDKVYLQAGTQVEMLATDQLESAGMLTGTQDKADYTLPVAVVVVLAILWVGYLRSRQSAAMQTNNGQVVAAQQRISRQQVIEAVKASELQPSPELHERLMKEIQK